MPEPVTLSPNARALAKLARKRSYAELAAQVGVSEACLRHIASGRRASSDGVRSKLLPLGLPLDGWVRPTRSKSARPASRLPSETSGAPETGTVTSNAPTRRSAPARTERPHRHRGDDQADPRTLALRIVRELEGELALAQDNDDYTPRERSSLATAATSALRLYARLSGSLEVTQAAILRSAAWLRIGAAFDRVFQKYPEANKALAEFIAVMQELGE